MMNAKMLFSGTSGLALPVRNKDSYPEAYRDKSRLTYYASLFNSLEINSTFKKLPRPGTVEKWASSVPDHFQFTFKLSSRITHNKSVAFTHEDVTDFMQVIARVGNKKGCLLVQFPGKITSAFSAQIERLLKGLHQANQDEQWKVAVEFRHSSWYQDETYNLLDQYHAAIVLHDMPSSTPPLKNTAAPFAYIRFHGPEKGYRGSYPDDFLHAYALSIKAWIQEGKTVYVYFNNTLGDAAHNLLKLNEFVEKLPGSATA